LTVSCRGFTPNTLTHFLKSRQNQTTIARNIKMKLFKEVNKEIEVYTYQQQDGSTYEDKQTFMELQLLSDARSIWIDEKCR